MYMYNINIISLAWVARSRREGKTTSNAFAKKQGGRLEFSSAKKRRMMKYKKIQCTVYFPWVIELLNSCMYFLCAHCTALELGKILVKENSLHYSFARLRRNSYHRLDVIHTRIARFSLFFRFLFTRLLCVSPVPYVSSQEEEEDNSTRRAALFLATYKNGGIPAVRILY